FEFIEAGHVLGSAMIQLTANTSTSEHTLTFTGDLGRRQLPLLRPTAAIPPADVLICESTYGDRLHEQIDTTIHQLYSAINRTINRGGKVLIPAFSLGRTQIIVHYLQDGIHSGAIPHVPIYVDSPLAADISEVYYSHPECLGPEARERLERDAI